MKPSVDRIRSVGNQRIEVVYADGLTAVLDFEAFLADHTGPIVEPLRKQAAFAAVRLEHGVVTWATGFDICPDVLRFWCEQGRVCSDQETAAHFKLQRSLSVPS